MIAVEPPNVTDPDGVRCPAPQLREASAEHAARILFGDDLTSPLEGLAIPFSSAAGMNESL